MDEDLECSSSWWTWKKWRWCNGPCRDDNGRGVVRLLMTVSHGDPSLPLTCRRQQDWWLRPSESLLLTHLQYVTPVCMCVCSWQVLSGWELGSFCVCDRQEGLSSRMHVQQQHFPQRCLERMNWSHVSTYRVDEGILSNLIRFSLHHLQVTKVINV